MALGIVSELEFNKDLINSGALNSVGIVEAERIKESVRDDRVVKVPVPVEVEVPVEDNSVSQPENNSPVVAETSTGIIEMLPSRGRGNGNKETPEILRKLIGEEGSLNSREDALALAESFGISPSSVSAYSNGSNSTATYNKPAPALESYLQGRKNRIIKKSSAKIMAAIDAIDEDKLLEAPAGVLAGIAKSLSGVIRDLEPPIVKQEEKPGPAVQFIMYAPKLIAEESLEYINVSE